ncbi:MAG: Modification methylase AplI [Lentisphaerae bacterium ADurb.Bin082]|nr:MAG: Modification methylase AplI [Lentisphaerae bacterium ADurb.Bin082]
MILSYTKQKEIIEYCLAKNIPLSDKLNQMGLTYDSLVYYDETERELLDKLPVFIPVCKRPKVAREIPCVSFFSGAGGLDIGFECAGFKTIAAVENVPMFCDTLRKNGHKVIIGPPNFEGDMSKPQEVIRQLESIGVSRNFSGVFHGGPPCQSFSVAANQRFNKSGENFKRTGFNHAKLGNLLFCYIEVICHFLPSTFLIENVDGLISIDGGEQAANACAILKNHGYDVTPPQVVNAADYGVPQRRMRTIIVGSRIGHFEYPPIQLFHLPAGCVFKENVNGLPNHQTRKHNAQSINRYMILKFGKRDKLGRVDRLDPFVPSKTIIAGGTGGGGRSHLHPFIPRTMSVRECARLQTFPDYYEFTGPVARQFTQCGNAVPPVLAYEMACAIYRSIYKRY